MRVETNSSDCICRRLAIVFVFLCPLWYTGMIDAQESEPEPSWKEWFAGELQLGLDAARSSRDGDITLDQVLRLKIDPPKHERFHIRTTLWTIEDLDGREDPTSTLRRLNDASGSSVQVRLLSLYLEVDDVGVFELVVVSWITAVVENRLVIQVFKLVGLHPQSIAGPA